MISLKKITALLATGAILISSLWATYAQTSFGTVLDWMHTNGLTKYNQVNDFRPNDLITRGEASKFVTNYAQFKGLSKNYNQCTFSDIEGYDYTLIPTIKEACEYGLMKGSNGVYNPNGNITEAQAITVVVRTLRWFLDETGAYRRQYYYEAGKELGIIQNETLQWVNQVNITRQKLGTRFYIAASKQQQEIDSLDGEMEFTSILEELFGDINL